MSSIIACLQCYIYSTILALVDLYLQTHLETEEDLIYFQRIFYFPEDMLRAWTKHPHRRWQVASVHFKTFNLQTVNLISRNDTLRKVKLSNFLLKNYLSPPFRNSAQLGKYKIQTVNPSRPRIRGWRATGGWWLLL